MCSSSVVLLVTGYWLLAVGYWLLVTGCWLLAAGYWLLVTGCWLLAATPACPASPAGHRQSRRSSPIAIDCIRGQSILPERPDPKGKDGGCRMSAVGRARVYTRHILHSSFVIRRTPFAVFRLLTFVRQSVKMEPFLMMEGSYGYGSVGRNGIDRRL